MLINKIKNLVVYSVIFFPIAFGVLACSQSNKKTSNTNTEIKADVIPSITAVAALGQLMPSGEIRQLAAPISQFGASPRLSKLLVNEGDFVEKGTVLAIFENREKLIADLEKKNNLITTNNL